MKIAFFGTPELAVTALDKLKETDLLPSLIVANPDAKVGRKQILTPPPSALWAKENGVDLVQPGSLKNQADLPILVESDWDLFIVVAYGKILPKWLLDIPKYGTINLHPSLLPKFRGPSPIRSAILADAPDTGVTIMQLDEKMDHGPILAQTKVEIDADKWPLDGLILDQLLAQTGANLLVETIPRFISGEISPTEQKHDQATFCSKITKDLSELKLDPAHLPAGKEAYDILLKVRAFAGWPETFFIHEGKRIKIKSARLSDSGELIIEKIVPEGKKEMDFKTYFSNQS